MTAAGATTDSGVRGVVHVVLCAWTSSDRAAAEREAERLVDLHLAHVPGILDVARGTSVSTEALEDGFDWALVVRFESEDALAAYLPHPEHQPVATHLGASAARLVVFDVSSG